MQQTTSRHRRQHRIEDSPGELAQFGKMLAAQDFRRAVISCLTDCTIDEDTVEGFGPDAAREIKLYASALEAELGRPIFLARVPLLPRLLGHARATYQLRHFDLMGDFRRARQALEEFQVTATRHDVTPELAAWAETQLADPSQRELTLKHFDLSTEETS